MADRDRVRVDVNSGFGGLWIAGWLFTIGFLGLGFLQGLLAIILWPYFLGKDLGVSDLTTPAAIEREAER